MYKGFNVVPKLVEAVNTGKPEAFITALKYSILRKRKQELEKELDRKYADKYLNEAGFYKETFVIYTAIDAKGRKIFKPEYYKPVTNLEDMKKPLVERELKEEYKKLVDEGKVAPTKEFFIKTNLEAAFKDIDINKLSRDDLINDGFDAFDKVTTKIADMYQQKAEEMVAKKPEMTLYQQQRYEAKLDLAKKYLNDGDKEAKQLLSITSNKLGISVDDYAKGIVEAATKWTSSLTKFKVLIDEYRVAVKQVFKSNPEAAVDILIEANKVFDDPSIEVIEAIFKKYTGQ